MRCSKTQLGKVIKIRDPPLKKSRITMLRKCSVTNIKAILSTTVLSKKRGKNQKSYQ